MNRILLSIGFVLCLTLPLRADRIPAIKGATPEKIVGGAENLGIMTRAKAITVFRVVSGKNKNGRKVVTVDREKCISPPKTVSGPEVQKVVAAFSKVSNFGEALMCDFDPGVILRFRTEVGALDIMVCFRCGGMVLFRDGKVVRRELKWARSINAFRKDARVAFTAVAKKAFPDDPEVKGLRD